MSLNTITLQYSGVRGQQKNTSYPFRKEISTPEELAEIAEFDHVCAVYADGKNTKGRMVRGYRSRKTFLEANCLPQDCDNANSDPLAPDVPPEEWKTPADVRAAFPGVPFYVVYSRNHMKEKNGKPARPKFHTYFVTRKITNTATMDALKKRVQEYFPAFDKEALDSARFLFGVENPQVEYYDGDTPLDVFIENMDKLPEQIPEGQRNGTISRYAARVFKKYGDTDEAERLVLEANETRCLPPMEDSEVQGILASARSFFHDTIKKDPNYIGPEEYAAMDFAGSGKKKPVTSEDIKEILNRMNITVRLNVLSGMVEITGMPPQYSKANAANVLPVLLSDYMKTHGMKFTRQGLDDSLVLIEDENRFNPIADMLHTVRHDGKDRLAELAEIAGIAEDETACLYLRKWLHQSVAMALNDDTDPYGADGVLVYLALVHVISHRFDPAMTIRGNSITFNNSCISKLEDATYIQFLINPTERKLAIRPCDEGARDAVRWCVVKGDKRKSREITCRPFTTKLYDLMGWESIYRYKLQGMRINYQGESLYLFDLSAKGPSCPRAVTRRPARSSGLNRSYPANGWRPLASASMNTGPRRRSI